MRSSLTDEETTLEKRRYVRCQGDCFKPHACGHVVRDVEGSLWRS